MLSKEEAPEILSRAFWYPTKETQKYCEIISIIILKNLAQ